MDAESFDNMIETVPADSGVDSVGNSPEVTEELPEEETFPEETADSEEEAIPEESETDVNEEGKADHEDHKEDSAEIQPEDVLEDSQEDVQDYETVVSEPVTMVDYSTELSGISGCLVMLVFFLGIACGLLSSRIMWERMKL